MLRSVRLQPVVAVAVTVIVFVLVTRVGLAVTASPSWTAGDMQVVIAVNGVHLPVLSTLAYGVNILLGPLSATVLTVALVGAVWIRTHSARPALRFGLLVALPWGLADVVKALVRRPRPDSALLEYATGVEPTTFSYPSGHTAFAVALAGAVVVVLTGRARAVALAAGIVVVLITAWSRLYLGAHYPTDVIASMVLVPTGTCAMHEILRRASWFTAPARGSGQQSAGQA